MFVQVSGVIVQSDLVNEYRVEIVKIKTILLASILFLVSVQVNAATPNTALADASKIAVWSESEVSPVPMPSAFWLSGVALMVFVSMSRKTKIN
jgi:hypothetical protein